MLTTILAAGFAFAAVPDRPRPRAMDFINPQMFVSIFTQGMKFKISHGPASAKINGPQIASPDTVACLRAGSNDLNRFGPNHPLATIMRFTQCSMVFDNVRPHEYGIYEHKRAGWSRADMVREEQFQAAVHDMVMSR